MGRLYLLDIKRGRVGFQRGRVGQNPFFEAHVRERAFFKVNPKEDR
jgi:hypothetical protein